MCSFPWFKVKMQGSISIWFTSNSEKMIYFRNLLFLLTPKKEKSHLSKLWITVSSAFHLFTEVFLITNVIITIYNQFLFSLQKSYPILKLIIYWNLEFSIIILFLVLTIMFIDSYIVYLIIDDYSTFYIHLILTSRCG